jgi:hypothetical protein
MDQPTTEGERRHRTGSLNRLNGFDRFRIVSGVARRLAEFDSGGALRAEIAAFYAGAAVFGRESRCLSAVGFRFLGILFPPGASAPLTIGLPVLESPDPDGVSVFHGGSS